ncbi:MAG TPA: Asp-tRNA(Asn)/Glu-tRNA(Gln) amidotransferase subunit GatB [Candidatus Alectryocaccobium stercorigallinarum]|nr:Asp-tRNA(Asn)/Glu-tRNA(Gln) amidotransferase subunit GatB [Candidatus Alectryocaccobium stercorigallinarum]
MNMEYETVIGFEVHIELNTKTKIFCGCSSAFGAEPNTNVCPVCTGMPGTLPVLNKKVVEKAIAAGLALNCNINDVCIFDRKNYFYPDNPQNYQISQLYAPICRDGYVEIETGGGVKRIRIHEIHMEEDAGKLLHDEEANCSYIDYNRSGVPLIEIVSEPDIRSAEEAIAYLEHIKTAAQYADISDCRMQEGSMRADLNISVRKKSEKKFGTRCEIKNLNSFRSVSRAIEFEAERQIKIIESGGTVVQETRHWDEKRSETYSSRSKEDAKDYRYFPEPDIPPVHISGEWVHKIWETLPEFRSDKIKRYISGFELPEYDAKLITQSKRLADLFEETVRLGAAPKKVSNWIMGELLRLLKENKEEPEDIRFTADSLYSLIKLVEDGIINNTVAKTVFGKMYLLNIEPVSFVEENGLKTVNDETALMEAVIKIIKDNPKAVQEYKEGKEKVLGFLVGQVMKETKGKAAPDLVRELLKKELT